MPPSTPTVPAPRTLREYLARPGAPTQRRLAAQAGTQQSMISMLSRGKRAARGKLALRLAAITGVPLASLLVATPQRRSLRPTTPPTTTTTTPVSTQLTS